jgi:hypothetical protein
MMFSTTTRTCRQFLAGLSTLIAVALISASAIPVAEGVKAVQQFLDFRRRCEFERNRDFSTVTASEITSDYILATATRCIILPVSGD